MPRTTKSRRVCFEPDNRLFSPGGCCSERVTLAMEELEAIRLIDLEEMEQDEAAQRMDVSRGTFQRILYSARRKVADALTGGKGIDICGGNYRLTGVPCEQSKKCRRCGLENEITKSINESDKGEQQNHGK